MLESQGNSFDYDQRSAGIVHGDTAAQEQTLLYPDLASEEGHLTLSWAATPHPWAHSFPLLMEMQVQRRPGTQQIAPVQLDCHANQKGTNMRGTGENCKGFSNAF